LGAPLGARLVPPLRAGAVASRRLVLGGFASPPPRGSPLALGSIAPYGGMSSGEGTKPLPLLITRYCPYPHNSHSSQSCGVDDSCSSQSCGADESRSSQSCGADDSRSSQSCGADDSCSSQSCGADESRSSQSCGADDSCSSHSCGANKFHSSQSCGVEPPRG